jgi:hypothetical protein
MVLVPQMRAMIAPIPPKNEKISSPVMVLRYVR